jgi:hypothetical protein
MWHIGSAEFSKTEIFQSDRESISKKHCCYMLCGFPFGEWLTSLEYKMHLPRDAHQQHLALSEHAFLSFQYIFNTESREREDVISKGMCRSSKEQKRTENTFTCFDFSLLDRTSVSMERCLCVLKAVRAATTNFNQACKAISIILSGVGVILFITPRCAPFFLYA